MIRRRLFNFATAVSLLLLFTAFLLSMRDRHFGATWIWHGASDVKHTVTWGGRFITLENEGQPSPGQLAAAVKELYIQPGNNPDFKWLAGSVGPESWMTGASRHYGVLIVETGDVEIDVAAPTQSFPSGIVCGSWSRVRVSIWVPMLLFSILPLLWVRRFVVARSRSSPGLCAKCGYNLTGNTSGVCPECGTAVPRKAKVVA